MRVIRTRVGAAVAFTVGGVGPGQMDGGLSPDRCSRIIGRFFQATMSLSPGTRLGHFEVTALLGEGGMCEDLAERWERRAGTAGAPRAVDVQSRPPAVRPPAEHF